jgi:hypothetical protein
MYQIGQQLPGMAWDGERGTGLVLPSSDCAYPNVSYGPPVVDMAASMADPDGPWVTSSQGGLGDFGECSGREQIAAGWFRPAGFTNDGDPDAYRCPPGYEKIGLRCMGPCGGYWCKPVQKGLSGLGEAPKEGGYGIGTVVVAFGLVALVGVLIATGR